MVSDSIILLKKLLKANQVKTNEIANKAIYSMKELRDAVVKKETPEKKPFEFNKQQKGKGLKILTPKQMIQRLAMALAQVKAGNTSENLLN